MAGKRIKTVVVQMYFSPDVLEVYEDLKQVSKATGMSMSEVAYAGFVTGFYDNKVRNTLLKFQKPVLEKKPKK